MSLTISLKRLPHGQDLPLPYYATPQSAGLDLAAAIESEHTLNPGERVLIPTGFALALSAGLEAQIRSRSGLAYNHGVTVLNSPGTIDADYRGEVKVLLINLGHQPFTLTRGMRIAQMVIAPVVQAALQEVKEFATDMDMSLRGSGGFGSTGR